MQKSHTIIIKKQWHIDQDRSQTVPMGGACTTGLSYTNKEGTPYADKI